MAREIHPTAIIDKTAEIGDDVVIGPYAFVGEDAKIGSGTRLYHHAHVGKWTEVGANNQIHIGAIVGHDPQDISYRGQRTFLKVGDGNIIREYAQIHRGKAEGECTTVGSNNFLMAMSHIAHNCRVGSGVIFANCALLGGHVDVEDRAVFAGGVAVHQFCRIGKLAMIGGLSGVGQDVPPFMMIRAGLAVNGYNAVGIRRAPEITPESAHEIKKAYKILYRSGLTLPNAILRLEELARTPEIEHLLAFLKAPSKRGIVRGVKDASA